MKKVLSVVMSMVLAIVLIGQSVEAAGGPVIGSPYTGPTNWEKPSGITGFTLPYTGNYAFYASGGGGYVYKDQAPTNLGRVFKLQLRLPKGTQVQFIPGADGEMITETSTTPARNGTLKGGDDGGLTVRHCTAGEPSYVIITEPGAAAVTYEFPGAAAQLGYSDKAVALDVATDWIRIDNEGGATYREIEVHHHDADPGNAGSSPYHCYKKHRGYGNTCTTWYGKVGALSGVLAGDRYGGWGNGDWRVCGCAGTCTVAQYCGGGVSETDFYAPAYGQLGHMEILSCTNYDGGHHCSGCDAPCWKDSNGVCKLGTQFKRCCKVLICRTPNFFVCNFGHKGEEVIPKDPDPPAPSDPPSPGYDYVRLESAFFGCSLVNQNDLSADGMPQTDVNFTSSKSPASYDGVEVKILTNYDTVVIFKDERTF